MTTDQFGGAEPLMDADARAARARGCAPLLARGEIPVVTGFIGATVDGVLTTLGRGGSDYSASILGAALDADEVWIWTDVDGVMTANPSEVPGAQTLPEISYSEASELAYYGAKVLHYKTILPAFRQRIPVRILNSFNPSHPGTRVSVEGDPSAPGVKAVTSIRGVSLIAISGTGHAGHSRDRRQGVRRRRRAAVERADDFAGLVREQHLLRHQRRRGAAASCEALRAALEIELARGHIEEIAAAAGGGRRGDRRSHARDARHRGDGVRRAGRRADQRHRDLAGLVRAEHLAGRGRSRMRRRRSERCTRRFVSSAPARRSS